MNKDYTQNLLFENHWEKDFGELRDEINTLLKQINPGLGEVNADKSIGQLVMVIKNEGNKLVGISTSSKRYIKQLRNYLYAIRITIVPGYRTPGLVNDLIVKTRDFLESVHKNDGPEKMIGIIVYVENVPLGVDGREAIWNDSQLVYIGNSNKGHHIRAYYFKGATVL